MNWMQRSVAHARDEEAGMTLIELMIVILILGILSAIIILGIGAFQGTGDSQACKASSNEVEAATAAYYAKNNAWPPDVASLTGSGNYLKNAPKASWNIQTSGGTVTNSCP